QLVLVTYRSTTYGWFVASPQVTIGDDGRASFEIPGAGAYALVVPDAMDPAIPVPDAGQPLAGVAMTPLPASATAAGTVSPATLPPAGGIAAGSLGIQSPTPLP